MRTKVSSKGRVVIPASIRRELSIRAGDSLEIAVDNDRIVLSLPKKPKYIARIIKDSLTGFSVLDVGPDAPILTSEMVRDLLKDFP